MEQKPSSHCINCSAKVEAVYCSQCGQKVEVNKLKWNTILSEVNQRVLGLDNKFAKTVRDLTIRPGHVVQLFIDGNRVKYIGPVGYLFILSTIYVLCVSILNVDMVEFTRNTSDIFTGQNAQGTKAEGLHRMLMDNLKIVSFALIPFFTLSTYILFRKKGYNLLETSVLIFYTHAHPLLLSFMALFAFKFWGVSGNSYVFPISIFFYAFGCASFYSGNKVMNFVKGLLGFTFGFILFAFLIAAFVILMLVVDNELARSILGQ
ncbi:DUF3667 domain-containing protein [Fulvivirga sp. 29W222]|uniref:DUF3667 domain-containing protein n=1 Tax=Fulvivirga marina TaxID=2494733 RepID=A0A937G3W5_9BACT|nr:DUF3667 domain-containing protein [Fulvivirga marina]MBL6449520.1 DUF3667 domain-containing protein [Fulvivirga marina]